MRIEKFCVGADEFEFSGIQLLRAAIGKIFYLRIFPRHDFGKIKRHFARAHAPRFRVFGEMLHFGGIEQGFCRHATAQDAQSADFFAAFNDNGFQSGACRRPRRRVTAAAAADDGHVEIKLPAFPFHNDSMGKRGGSYKLFTKNLERFFADWCLMIQTDNERLNMKFIVTILFLGAAGLLAAFAQPSLTIYNQNFAVVRDTVPLDLQSGVNTVRYAGRDGASRAGLGDFARPERQTFAANPRAELSQRSRFAGIAAVAVTRARRLILKTSA